MQHQNMPLPRSPQTVPADGDAMDLAVPGFSHSPNVTASDNTPGSSVCAVMVTHNPGGKFGVVLDSFLGQVDHLVIVDNASDCEARRTLDEVAAAHPGRVTLILNAANAWLARALNQGIDWAAERDYRYVLLMNDGNILSPNAVSRMLRRFDQAELGLVGSVNPRVVIGDKPSESDKNAPPFDELLTVTAGQLISMDAIRAGGPQREDFLVDMVDYDFGFRLNRHGFRTITEPTVSIACELGRTTRRRFLWKTCNVENYSPVRRYYFARNGLTLLHESRSPALGKFWTYFLLASVAKVVLYEEDKLEKLRMTVLGIVHSLRGRLGEYTEKV